MMHCYSDQSSSSRQFQSLKFCHCSCFIGQGFQIQAYPNREQDPSLGSLLQDQEGFASKLEIVRLDYLFIDYQLGFKKYSVNKM